MQICLNTRMSSCTQESIWLLSYFCAYRFHCTQNTLPLQPNRGDESASSIRVAIGSSEIGFATRSEHCCVELEKLPSSIRIRNQQALVHPLHVSTFLGEKKRV
jgi:hypothetical protein